MQKTHDIVQKLWNLCAVLWHGGVTYHQYVNELTYVLFLKMAEETGTESQIPEGCRWNRLRALSGTEQLTFYRKLLIDLGSLGSPQVQAIFANAATIITQPRTLAALVTAIDGLDWYSAREEGLGDMYEGLLEKNATESKRGAGQYFTPRPLIESMVHCMQPQAGEIIQDPAAGTGGFLINADRYIKARTDNLFKLSAKEQDFQRRKAFQGMELVPDVHRLCLMNMLLHDIEGQVALGDTLGPAGARLPKADCILTNPPFGSQGGGGGSRDDFTFVTNNRQLAFLQHVYRGLKPGGRAAVVLPDNVLFEDNTGRSIRTDLMDKCELHTVLRLPTGIFYAQGVKTNVLFFRRGRTDAGNTKEVWFYDLRTNMPSFGKTSPLRRTHFSDFEFAYLHTDRRKVRDERWSVLSRADIAARGDSLDLGLIRDDSVLEYADLPDPADSGEECAALLEEAAELLRGVARELRALGKGAQ